MRADLYQRRDPAVLLRGLARRPTNAGDKTTTPLVAALLCRPLFALVMYLGDRERRHPPSSAGAVCRIPPGFATRLRRVTLSARHE